MNSLSWAIYLIYVISSAHLLGVFLIVLSGIMAVIMIAAWTISEGDFNPWKLKLVKWPIIIFIIGLPIVVVVPNERTTILIASSEVGEKVLNSEKVKGILDPSTDLLKSWIELETKKIKNELDRETGKKK